MNFKIAIMTVFKDLKDHMNKYLNEDCGNRKIKLNEIAKTIQAIKVELDKEVESLKRLQIKINLEMKKTYMSNKSLRGKAALTPKDYKTWKRKCHVLKTW